jgi:hypothetical protein
MFLVIELVCLGFLVVFVLFRTKHYSELSLHLLTHKISSTLSSKMTIIQTTMPSYVTKSFLPVCIPKYRAKCNMIHWFICLWIRPSKNLPMLP